MKEHTIVKSDNETFLDGRILDIVSTIPMIHQNELKRILVTIGRYTTTITMQKHLTNLEKEGKLHSKKFRNTKQYFVPGEFSFVENDTLSRKLDQKYNEITNQLKEMKREFSNYGEYVKFNAIQNFDVMLDICRNLTISYKNQNVFDSDEEGCFYSDIMKITKGTTDQKLLELVAKSEKEYHSAYEERDVIRKIIRQIKKNEDIPKYRLHEKLSDKKKRLRKKIDDLILTWNDIQDYVIQHDQNFHDK